MDNSLATLISQTSLNNAQQAKAYNMLISNLSNTLDSGMIEKHSESSPVRTTLEVLGPLAGLATMAYLGYKHAPGITSRLQRFFDNGKIINGAKQTNGVFPSDIKRLLDEANSNIDFKYQMFKHRNLIDGTEKTLFDKIIEGLRK